MTSTLHLRRELGRRSQHMVICGDDGLAHRPALALTHRDDGKNLDIAMAARERNPAVRVVMRLYDDDLAATDQRTVRGLLRRPRRQDRVKVGRLCAKMPQTRTEARRMRTQPGVHPRTTEPSCAGGGRRSTRPCPS
ncbi:hypothetical protein AB5J72_27045 [Streptomyces sp. CG1]|uniref:hypothetical protein n=1 Tax=Streptomyces sp. CG1 TaxID=1287523 RepID=UPI0034E291BA